MFVGFTKRSQFFAISHFFVEAVLGDEGLLGFGGVGERGEAEFAPVDFAAGDAFGLDFAELVEGTVEGVLGGGSGSFDGADLFFEHGVDEGVDDAAIGEVAVGEVAAAAPAIWLARVFSRRPAGQSSWNMVSKKSL